MQTNRVIFSTVFFVLAHVTFLGADELPPIQAPVPMRPLPTASQRPLGTGPAWYVDAAKGDDAGQGTQQHPWKTLAHSLRQLRPGDTLYLRGGVHYAHPVLTQSGTEQAPITIRSYPGELATIDGGFPEFVNDPADAWMPFEEGAPGEFVSTRRYAGADDRQVPHQFLPGSWEPYWGIEEERPLALGHLADSMIPLHGYRLAVDLRSSNELWLGGKSEMRDTGIYGGPGLWFNRDSGRIHIRLAHHRLSGLGANAYRGETDPRKLRLVIAAGFGGDVLRINGVKHVQVQDLVFRGATGSPMVNIYGSEEIRLDHCTLFGGFPALLVNASKNIRVTNCAVRGLAAPWTSRAHMKYRGTPSYQIVLQNNQPANENIEFAWCEFTDDHDFAFLRYARNLQFHHNYVDNFNDDGLECGPKHRDHTLFIYQNHIGRCLIPLSQHEIEKDESPLEHQANSGVYLFRNVIDTRGGTYKSPPGVDDPTGRFLNEEGHLVGDHGSPVWSVIYAYHNTLLRDTTVFRDSYLFGLGSAGLRQTERDVFNNIFFQKDRVPGVGFVGLKEATKVREGGNLIWGIQENAVTTDDYFAKFRASALFKSSRLYYEPGWTTQDLVADPQFLNLAAAGSEATDLRLKASSPAINSGVALPATWPDPLRDRDPDRPDAGAFPAGIEPWTVGVDGRRSIMQP